MNESTFETHLASSLQRIFPTILPARIETQTVFTLRFGHGVLDVDGKASYVKGRSDVILRINEKPSVLLELKRPELPLNDEDVTQAISYACVHKPMIAIVVVTNGSEVRIHSSFDGSRIEGETLDEQRIGTLFQVAAKQAASSREEAIRNLIAGSSAAWAGAIRSRTKQMLSELTGAMEDLTRPLCSNFWFPRMATPVLAASLATGERALALVGPPTSGKTNVLAELCNRSEEFEIAPLYIDCADSEDLLAEIGIALSDSLGVAISSDKIFDWLRIGIGDVRVGRPRLVLVLDSLVPEESAHLRKQAVTLLKSVGPNVAILLSLTDTAFEMMRNVSGRWISSKLGRDIKIIPLYELNEDEIDVASRNLSHQTRIVIPAGAQFEPAMRHPRTIRLMLAMNETLQQIPDGQYAKLPSIVSSEVLAKLWETTRVNPELRSDLLALARGYVKDEERRSVDAKLRLVSIGVGTMTLNAAENILPATSFERLLRQGHIKRLPLAEQIVVLPTVPELLSAALISVLKSIILDTGRSQNHQAATKQLLQYTAGVSLGDRVGALLLQELVSEDGELFWNIFQNLMNDEPKQEKMRDGSFLMQLPNGEVTEMRRIGQSMIIKLPDGSEATSPRLPSVVYHPH